MSHTNNRTPLRLSDAQDGLSDPAIKRCREALMDVRKSLEVAPEVHASRWYNLSSRPETVKQQFVEVSMMRAVLASAAKVGPDALQETKALVRACFARLEQEALQGFEASAPACRLVASADVAKELGEAIAASANYAARPSPSTQATAAVETEQALETAERFTRFLASQQLTYRQPLSA